MILRVVPVVGLRVPLTIQGQNLRRHTIQEIAIVADRDDRSLIGVERCFQSLTGGNVEVVRRFVEQQHVHARVD